MKRFMPILFVVGLMALVLSQALALTDTATQTIVLDIDEIAVVDVTGDPATATITAPGTGGLPPVISPADTSTYVQYTSIVDTLGSVRDLDAAVTAGTIPLGLDLDLVCLAINAGTGNCGSPVAGGVTFNNGSLVGGTIVDTIGSCYTGVGATDGAQLSYEWFITNVADLLGGDSGVPITTTLTVTLTLQDDTP